MLHMTDVALVKLIRINNLGSNLKLSLSIQTVTKL